MTQEKNISKPVSSISTSTLVTEIALKFKALPRKKIKEVLHSFLSAIENSITSGNKIRIDKLGILQAKDRAARKGRNPQTGEEIMIPASKKIAFRIALSLKEAIGMKTKKTSTKKAAASKKTK
jgi:DNA-binding protein HU-beta